MSKVAVTGGAGFLGSHIFKKLLDLGEDAIIIDDFSSGSMENLRDLGVDDSRRIIVGDLKEYAFAKKSLQGIEAVFHFAAEVGSVQYLHGSAENELAAMQSNLVIDSNVFRACMQSKVKCIIFASSVSVYPFDEQLRPGAFFSEEDSERKVNPDGGYGWSKLVAEKELELMQSRVKVGIARIFHAYGKNIYLKPDRSQVLASLIRKAISYPKEGFVVWGNGEQKRCFVYIDDVLDALFSLRDYVQNNKSLTINLGSQEEITVKELAERIIALSGKKIEMSFDLSKPTGALNRKPDLKRIEEKLSWKPRTSLKEGLPSTYEWARTRLAENK